MFFEGMDQVLFDFVLAPIKVMPNMCNCSSLFEKFVSVDSPTC